MTLVCRCCVSVGEDLVWFRGSCEVVEFSAITVRCRCSEQGLFAVLATSVGCFSTLDSECFIC